MHACRVQRRMEEGGEGEVEEVVVVVEGGVAVKPASDDHDGKYLDTHTSYIHTY